jgi:prepilin signal peptidase PulO-like enzyme (type II secretory pathway)
MMVEFIIFVLGICIGSFLNVAIDRIPSGESIAKGRSYCDHCKKTLRWYELLPIVSWVLQGGKCLRCKKTLSIQYPVIELITGLGFVYIVHTLPSSLIISISSFIIFSVLLVTLVVDLKYELISDVHMAIVFIATSILHYTSLQSISSVIPYLLAGLGASLLFFFFWAFSGGKAMGFGDVELAFILGFLAGFPAIVFGLYIAFLTGAVLGVILILKGNKTLKSHVPFGPFLIAGTGIAMLYSVQIQALLKGILW